MKIVSWNCGGSFRTKASQIAEHQPDIAIIQECECEKTIYSEKSFPKTLKVKRFGTFPSEYKGIGVMSCTGLNFELDNSYNPNIKHCIPLKVTGYVNFNLIAVWTIGHQDHKKSYIGQVYQAINHYRDFISSADTIIIGDFNSNQKWDKTRSVGNHTDVVNGLKQMGLVSLFHEINSIPHGSESVNTFFPNNKKQPHHIDYCFAPESWKDRVKKFDIGDHSEWAMSDHSPLFVEFE